MLPVPAGCGVREQVSVSAPPSPARSRMRDPSLRYKRSRSRSPVHELLGSATGGATVEKSWRIQMMIEYTPIPESGEHEPEQEIKDSSKKLSADADANGSVGKTPSVISLGAAARRSRSPSPMTPRSGSGVNVQTAPSSPPTRRCSSPSPASPAPARRGEHDRRVSAPSAIPGTGRRGSSPDPIKQLEKLQEMFEEDRAADIMAAADRDAGALPIVVNGRVVPQLTTQCWEPAHAPKIRVTGTASLPVGTPPSAVPVIQVTTPSPQTSPHVRRRSLDYEAYSSASLYSQGDEEEVHERPVSALDGAEQEEEESGGAAPAAKSDQMAAPEPAQGGARPRAGTWSLGHRVTGPPGRQRRRSGDDVASAATGSSSARSAGAASPQDSPSKKPTFLDSFRPRSKSDATRSMRRPNLITSMKTTLQQTIVGAPPGGKGPPASLPTSPQAADGLEPPRHRARSGSESSKSAVRSVIDRIRGRSQSVVEADKRKFGKSHSTISSSSFNANLYRRHDDPYRRRSLSGGDAISDHNRMAMLFRDSRGLPVVDPFMDTLHSTDLKDDESQIYIKFFKFHKCYDLIPTSAKLVVFDTQLLVKKAFFALVYNGVRAAPLWDSRKQQFVGMLTITDFIRILQMYYRNSDERIEELEEHKLETWRTVLESDSKPLIYIAPEASLHEAIVTLLENRIHRLPVIDPVSGDVLYIITHKRILRFLCLYIHNLPRPSFVNRTLGELRIGTYDSIETARPDTPVIEALTKFVNRRVSALPIVDSDNKLTHIYAKFDVINLAAEKTYNNLNVPLMTANSHRSDNKVEACQLSDTLNQVIDKIVHAEVHRLVITDEEQHVIGIISLSDILDALVLRPHEYNIDPAVEVGSEAAAEELAREATESHTIPEEEPGDEEEPVAAAAGVAQLTIASDAPH